MMTAGLDRTIQRLEPVSLCQLEAAAALLTRKDRKYVVPEAMLDALAGGLDPRTRVLEIEGTRTFRYESVYFDTPDLLMYHQAARSRPRRAKVRTRTYVNTGGCMLEVKSRDRAGSTVKYRHPYPIENRARLTGDGRDFVARFEEVGAVGALRPTLTTRYDRTTLLLPDRRSRVTIDTDLEYVDPDDTSLGVIGYALVETKSANGPTAVDRILWAAHHRPASISKYCTGLAALRGDLPANKWHRVLRILTDAPLSYRSPSPIPHTR